jgi:hypothetical protein
MRQAILGAAVAACFSTAALGFVPKDATYYCAAEISAGLSFDKSSKKWAGMKFGTDEKFILQMKYLNSRKVEYPLETVVVGDFNVTITRSGFHESPCTYDGGDKVQPVTVNERDIFKCTSNLFQYLISVKSNRFLQTYVGTYVVGDEDRAEQDTPTVTGGTCSKNE